MMEVAQKTVTPIQQIYDFPITEFFWYASYLVEQNEKQIREMKKLSKRP